MSGDLGGGSIAVIVPREKLRIPLARGQTNTAQVSVMVVADAPWQLVTSDPKGANTGYMTTRDVPAVRLKESLRAVFGATELELQLPGVLASGAGNMKVPTELHQLVVPQDLPGDYAIDVLFVAVAVF